MKLRVKYPMLIALAVCVMTYAASPVSVLAQSRQPRQMTQQQTEEALRQPVPDAELQTFQSDMTTLVHALYDLNASHPDSQRQMLAIQQKLTTLTPDQWTVLANAYDRSSLSQGVAQIKAAMPNLAARPRGQMVRQSSLALTPLDTPAPSPSQSVIDPDSNTSLVEPSYGPCTPNYIDANNDFNGIYPIPSNATTDYGLFIGLSVANAAQIPLNFLCQELTVIIGEGTNLPECIPAAIDQAIAFALQLALQITDWCNGPVLAAESDAAWWNSIAIFNNLNSGVSSLQTQITSTQTDLDNHITTVDADLNAHITAIDTDIDNHVAGINVNVNSGITNSITSLSNQLTATNTDIDGRVTAVNANVTSVNSSLSSQLTATNTDIDTRIAGLSTTTNNSSTAIGSLIATDITAIDTDIDSRLTNAVTTLNTSLTAVQTNLNTHLSAVDTDVLAQGALVGTDIATLQSLDLRVAIEKSLEQGLPIGLFELPKAQGGYLELVGTIVQSVITNLVAAGQNIGNSGAAQKYENQGNASVAAGNFKQAYYSYMSAYETAVK